MAVAGFRPWVCTLGDLVHAAAVEWPDADAVVFPEKRVSFAELDARSEAYARALVASGVGATERVGILMVNRIEYLAVLFGSARIGAVPVPINGRFKVDELGYVLRDACFRTIITARGTAEAPNYPDMLSDALAELSVPAMPPEVVGLDEVSGPFMTASDYLARGTGVDEGELQRRKDGVHLRSVGLMIYTSGTTARPKGCLLSHEALVRNGRNVAFTRFMLSPEDRLWDPLPFFHMSSLLPLLGCLWSGAAYCSLDQFDAETAVRQLVAERCTVTAQAFETIWLAVLNHAASSRADLSRVRLVVSVGVEERLRQMQQRVPSAVQISAYGSTEGAGVIAYNEPGDPLEVRVQTCGRPMPGMEVKIVDPATGVAAERGAPGEILFRGYGLFDGYHGDPELTRKVIDGDGWFHTGDLGRLDPEGRIIFAGRLKDMLKVGGENVAAVEVETFLARHPAVEIVQVVAAPDDHYGEVAAAFIQLREGTTASAPDLIDFCRGRIATFKVPRYVRFIEQWPMSGTKIQKFKLREMIVTELAEKGIRVAPKITSGAGRSRPQSPHRGG